ncbi:hypothetical protein VNO80_26339 [Phaseolus coccineus]|uniref:Uncharacterized protein n=1 Tax=Phaseolus coccineus TaxID=3886 RepID=A0AAN9QGL9_PHACN
MCNSHTLLIMRGVNEVLEGEWVTDDGAPTVGEGNFQAAAPDKETELDHRYHGNLAAERKYFAVGGNVVGNCAATHDNMRQSAICARMSCDGGPARWYSVGSGNFGAKSVINIAIINGVRDNKGGDDEGGGGPGNPDKETELDHRYHGNLAAERKYFAVGGNVVGNCAATHDNMRQSAICARMSCDGGPARWYSVGSGNFGAKSVINIAIINGVRDNKGGDDEGGGGPGNVSI